MKRVIAFIKDWKKQSEYLNWLLNYSKPYLFRITILLVISISSMLFSVGLAVLSKDIIDKATKGMSILMILIIYIGIMFVMQLFKIISQLISQNLNEKYSFGIKKQIFDKVIKADWLSVNHYHTGDLMTRLTSDANSISTGIISTIPNIIALLVELIVTFITLFYYEPMLAVFALVLAPVSTLISVWFGRKLKKIHVKVQESEAAYRSFMQESFANLLVVKAFSHEDYSVERLAELRDERYKWVKKKNTYGIISSTVLSLTFQIGYIVAFTYGAVHLSNGAISYGTMSLFLTLVNRVQAPIVGLAREIPAIVSILASAGRVMELQNLSNEKTCEEVIDSKDIGVSASNVAYRYSDELPEIFSSASLDIKPGEFVALIGESGIGKTTLIRLMMSFVSNYTGNITFYNAQGEKVDANSKTREFISYVPQGNTLFSGTVRNNILMGKHDATKEELEWAIKIADATEFISGLPNGIDTVIGERGYGISEGQAQRIAIARAVIKKAPFLILDEATSSLDSETELHVLKGLLEMKPRPTCLIVTHRESVLAYCDRKLTIDDGTVF